MKVAASIQPLADFCRRVGGERVEVMLLVPAGASPHTFEPAVEQMRFLAEARLVVLNGLGLESWASDILGKAGNPGLTKVEAAGAVPEADLIGALGEEAGGAHGHGVYDPHVWLDPELAARQVGAIRDALEEADPGHAQEYRANAAAFLEELEALDGRVRGRVDAFARKAFVAFHSSWVYFARRYGLEMVGVVEELPGKEPSASDIAGLLEAIKAEGVTVIFAEPQFSTRAAEAVAESSAGRVKVAVLDPLGNPGDPAVETYLKMMDRNVAVMEEALR